MERTFSIHTIGCKLNQFESEWIREALLRRRWEFRRFEDGAQFHIINSCTVTGRSDARCRNAVRRARKRRPDSFIIVTGCYAEVQPTALTALGEVDLVLGNGRKSSLPAIMEEIASRRTPETEIPDGMAMAGITGEEGAIDCFLDHSRAFVKIQDGCDASCSYCIVPRARGHSRSVPVEAVLKQISILAERGFHEIVLSGIHLGRYGLDLEPTSSLASLVEKLIDRGDNLRFRLSSIEVNELAPRLVDLIAHDDRLAPHLHVPLQSGDDSVLRAMNRPYDAAGFKAKIEEIALKRPGVGIGTDIIVGFPGETEGCFEHTLGLVRELPLSYFHVFSFSSRPGTAAAAMPDRVDPAEKKRRSAVLIALGRRKKLAFMRAQIGAVERALIQEPAHRASPFCEALTGNYCGVRVPRESAAPGTLARVRITHYSRGTLYGSYAPDPASDASRAGKGKR